MGASLRELRHAVRHLVRNLGFTTAILLTLGLGVGGTTALFAVLRGVILDPLPFPAADRLLRLKSVVPGVGSDAEWDLSTAQYLYYREHAGQLDELGAYRLMGVNVGGVTEANRATAAIVTASFLSLIGARAEVGRLINEMDDRPGAPSIIVLSHSYWQREFGSDPNIVGRIILVNERPAEVIGVMGSGVLLPGEPASASSLVLPDLWGPYRINPAGPFFDSHSVLVIGRLAGGITVSSAQEEIDRLTAHLPEAFPSVYSADFMQRYAFRAELRPLKTYVVGSTARYVWIIFAAVALMLLVSVANVANLLLVRTESRRPELALRSALGAGRAAIARLLVAECLVIAAAGSVLAILMGYWGLQWLRASAPATIPRLENVMLDSGGALFAIATACVVGVALGVVLVVSHGRPATGVTSRPFTTGRERQRLRSILIATQVALAVVLIVAAGLLVESFNRLRGKDPGIVVDGVLTGRIHLPPGPGRYASHDAVWQFHDQLLARIAAIPGVSSVAVGTAVPLVGEYEQYVQTFEDPAVLERLGATEGTATAELVRVSPDYFATIGIRMVAGRTISASDHEHPQVGSVVVSRAFAERYWPGESALGKGMRPGAGDEGGGTYYRVVGIVDDVPLRSLEGGAALAVYYPLVPLPGQWSPPPAWNLQLVVRTGRIEPTAVISAIRAAIAELDLAVPLSGVETLREVVDRSTSRLGFSMMLLALAAGAALLLAAIGLHGVVAFVVARRTREIGIRVALGAEPRQVASEIVRGSMKIVGAGLLIGIGSALLLTRAMQAVLYGVESTHLPAYVLAIVILAGSALAAALAPARRAAGVDPAITLKAH